jgi:hypothetical protein
MQRKTKLAVAVAGALLAAGTTAQAQVTGAQQGINVQLYGQVSRAVMMVDDGHASKWFHVDGQPSSTRFGINASAPITPGLRVGARIETEIKSNPSDRVSFATPSKGALAADAVGFAERWLDAYIEGGWGRINMGQGSGAADDISTIDLSGTGMPNGNCPTDWAGGISFRTSAGAVLPGNLARPGATGGAGLGGCNDFESRYDRLQYTTPTFGGFRAQGSHGQLDSTAEVNEASLWYTGKLAGDLQAGVGWAKANVSTPAGARDRETMGFGASWLSAAGFNVTLQGTQVKGISGTAADDRKAKYYNIKLGYKMGATHAFAVDYGVYKDQAARDDDGKSIGLGYVWSPVRWTEIYAGYHVFTLDRPAVSIEDIKAYVIGTRIRF